MDYLEPAELALEIGPFDFNSINPSTSRTNIAKLHELFEHLSLSFCDGFDSSIRKISNPAGDSNPPGHICYLSSKKHALHEPPDYDSSTCLHSWTVTTS